jgi:hypothetical protein
MVRAITSPSCFDNQVVAGRRIDRRAHDRVIAPAQIAREQDRAPGALHVDHRRAEDMAGMQKARTDTVDDLELALEGLGFEGLKRRQCVGLAVQRQRRLVLGPAAAVGVGGLLLLQPSAVRQHDPAQVESRPRRIHRTLETIAHDGRQIAGMVDVGMRQQHRVEFGWIERRLGPVAQAQLLEALVETAVDQHLAAACAQQIARAGDGAGGTEKSNVQSKTLRQWGQVRSVGAAGACGTDLGQPASTQKSCLSAQPFVPMRFTGDSAGFSNQRK